MTSEKLLNPPTVPEVGVVALVPNMWGPQWEVRHQVLVRLADYFNVVWINPAHDLRDAVAAIRRSPKTFVEVRPGLTVYTPEPWLGTVYRPRWLARAIFHRRLHRAISVLERRGCTKLVLYLWRPEYAEALDVREFDLTCYHIDDEYSFSENDVPTSDLEKRVITTVDQVFIHSPGLLEKKGDLNPNTTFVPNGVDFDAFAAPSPEPSDLQSIPHPRVGYTGRLKTTLDWPLLFDLASKHSTWQFVFVGQRRPQRDLDDILRKMGTRPNVHFLGGKTTAEAAAYPQHFDVCIMPYRLTDYAKYGYPLKLHEYLATGRPTVGARMRTLEDFEDVVMLPRSPEEWSDAIGRGLTPEEASPERLEQRRNVARQHDWDALVRRIGLAMAHHLGPDIERAFHAP